MATRKRTTTKSAQSSDNPKPASRKRAGRAKPTDSTPQENKAARGRNAKGRKSAHKTTVTDALKGLGGSWKKSRSVKPRSQSTIADIPDGSYCAQLTGTKLDISKRTKNPYFRLEFVICRGDYEGEKLTTIMTLSDKVINDEGTTLLDLFSQTIQALGVETDSMTEQDVAELPSFLLDESANPNAKPIVSVAVRTKPDDAGTVRQNVYVNRILEDDEIENWEDTYVEN